MSEHIEYMKEKTSIDVLLNNGYTIKSITENLSGAFVSLRELQVQRFTLKRYTY